MKAPGATVRDTYDRYAPVYDRLYGWVLQDGRRKLARMIERAPGRTLLEMGVGSGLMLPLYPARLSVTGIDVSDGMLARAREKVSRLPGRDITLVHGDCEATALGDAAFDHVVLPYTYSVTPSPAALMRESFRVCRPGGSIWILNHFSGEGGVWDVAGWLASPFARFVGFSSDFPFDEHVGCKGWQIEGVTRANPMGLSRIVQVRKPPAP